jgi:nickel/cobalt exporter
MDRACSCIEIEQWSCHESGANNRSFRGRGAASGAKPRTFCELARQPCAALPALIEAHYQSERNPIMVPRCTLAHHERGGTVIMGIAMLYGAGSGALHAVTGPDHLLSLGPAALRHPQAPFRVGLAWGAGHGLGTLLLALPALWFAQAVHLPTFAAWGERLAGAALVAMALWSMFSWRAGEASAESARSPALVGFVHGITGAGGLLLMLPVLVSGSPTRVLAFLATFVLGSTLAMALFTSLLARVGSKLGRRVIQRAQWLLMLTSLAVGAVWLVGA